MEITIKQPKKCLVNSWSAGNCTVKNVSRHNSYHGSVDGISMDNLSVT